MVRTMTYFLVAIPLWCIAAYSYAAPLISFDAPVEVASGEVFAVRVLLSSDVALNAIEASLAYPTTLLEFVSIDRTGSVFDFWRSEPDASVPGSVRFEAGARRAFSGEQGEVFALGFRALGSGTASLSFAELALYAADGKATRLQAGVLPISMLISSPSHAADDKILGHPISQDFEGDAVSPEFIEVSVAESRVDGARLLVFDVRDASSGISSVAARERGFWPWWGAWRRVATPLVLAESVRQVELRAVDRAGNEARERVLVRGGVNLVLFLSVAFSVLALALLAFVWKKWRRG